MDTYNSKSYLSNTNYNKFYLDVANLPSLKNATGDYVVVPPECENRIDLFSYQQYGSSRLWWIIAIANADVITDPLWDFKAGLTLLVPRNTVLIEQLSGVR
jgi:hypothetical protein